MRSLAIVALLALTVAGCAGSPGDDVAAEPTRDTEDAVDVRKQVYELTAGDLEEFPVWEFAQDEEGVEGRTRPRSSRVLTCPGASNPTPTKGSSWCGPSSRPPTARLLAVFVSPEPDGGLRNVQPSVVTRDGQVSFWFGIVEPRPGVIDRSYTRLGKRPAELFPITFRTAVPVDGEVMEGWIPGFLYLDDRGETQVISRRGTRGG